MSARVGEIVRRVVQGALGGVVVASLGGALEAAWARAAAGASAPSFGPLWLAIVGLSGPIALVVGIGLSVAFAWLSPDEPPSPSAWIRGLRRAAEGGRRADVAAFVPLVVLAGFLWATCAAHLARATLSLELAPRVVGVATVAASLALAVVLAIVALALVPPLRRTLAARAEHSAAAVDPVVTGAAALAISMAAFVTGMATGTISGEGGFLGVYGIFKRPELDLRAPLLLASSALGALFAPSLAKPPRSPSPGVLLGLALVALGPIGLTARAARDLSRHPELAQALERGAPLAKLPLGPLRRASDRDKDGASAAFGGGDCDDANPAIRPGAEEVIDNGVDEDCSGADLTRRAIEQLAPAPEAARVDERLVPPDLNVVLVTIDTLRHDLGFAGYERPISPNLDALAARSVVFEHAYALASYTGKSIGPTLIGKYGSETNRNWGHFNKFGPEDTFLAERLARSGVRTMAVHAHRYFDDFGGLDRGFAVRDFSAAPPKDAPWDIDTKETSRALTEAALGVLAQPENTSGRFFLWVHYLDPHADYLRHDGVDFGRSPRDLYDGEVAHTDAEIGRLLGAIERADWGKRTAVVVTSDHGEAFGEHGMYRHGFEVWEPLVRVPLLVHVPGVTPRRVKARRSLVDLVPTVLELMRVAPPEPLAPGAAGTDFLSGQSLLVDAYLPPGAVPAERDVLVDMPAGPYNDARRALISGDLKLTVAGEARFDLFDLAADPGEVDNLASRDKGRLGAMKERYAALRARLREVRVTGKRK